MPRRIGLAEILGRERRRRWNDAEKAEIVAESFRRGASVSWVARRHGVSASQLFNWRKAARRGAADGSPDLIPVVLTGSALSQPMGPTLRGPPDTASIDGAPSAGVAARIEIAFPNGRRLVAPAGLDPRLMERLIQSVAR
jgi:transposase